MSLFLVTDNLTHFRASNAPFKLYYHDCYIKDQQGFDQNKIDQFNFTSATTIEFKAAGAMHEELEKVFLSLPIDLFVPNKYLLGLSKRDQLYAYFYDYFKKYVLLKYMFLLMLEQFVEAFGKEIKSEQLQLELSSDLKIIVPELAKRFPSFTISTNFYDTSIIRKYNPRFARVKKLAYPLYEALFTLKSKIKPRIKRGKYHFLLLTYDVSSDALLLQHFFELVKNNSDLSLSIVQIATGMEAKFNYSFQPFACSNIEVFRFEEFRKFARQNKNESFFSMLTEKFSVFKSLDENLHFKGSELHYEWISNILEKTNPSICYYTNQAEMGRVLAHVARFKNIPSVFVEYSFTFDSPFLKSNIPFTARACISALTAANWKRNNDPSRYELVLGYCKHDFLSKRNPDKIQFSAQHNLNANQKTVLFASTWCSGNKIFDDEKASIIDGLSKFCFSNNWNLIVKKHPVEVDLIADEVVKKNNYPNQKVFTNEQLSLSDAVLLADFMCCQSSSAILDAVYFEKPFAFVSLTSGESLADYLFADKKNKIHEYHSLEALETYLKELFTKPEALFETLKNATALKRELLYLADGNACGRLIDFSIKLVDKGSLDAESLVALQIETV